MKCVLLIVRRSAVLLSWSIMLVLAASKATVQITAIYSRRNQQRSNLTKANQALTAFLVWSSVLKFDFISVSTLSNAQNMLFLRVGALNWLNELLNRNPMLPRPLLTMVKVPCTQPSPQRQRNKTLNPKQPQQPTKHNTLIEP